MRESIIERLKQDLIGPFANDEILSSRPSDIYLTGILWPSQSIIEPEEDERLDTSGSLENDTGGELDEETPIFNLSRPCSAGLSFAAKSLNEEKPLVNVAIRFALYLPKQGSEHETSEASGDKTSSKKRIGIVRNSIC